MIYLPFSVSNEDAYRSCKAFKRLSSPRIFHAYPKLEVPRYSRPFCPFYLRSRNIDSFSAFKGFPRDTTSANPELCWLWFEMWISRLQSAFKTFGLTSMLIGVPNIAIFGCRHKCWTTGSSKRALWPINNQTLRPPSNIDTKPMSFKQAFSYITGKASLRVAVVFLACILSSLCPRN